MLFLVPLEPLTERYTESWYRNIPKLFPDCTVIDGSTLVNDTIKVGTFLDINSTVFYKNSQLQKIARLFHKGKVRDGDVFFFYDAEFWGVEAVKLMAQLNHVKVKLCAFLHAASYTYGDAFEIAYSYQRFTEVGWYKLFDKIFVGSEYHRGAFYDRRLCEHHIPLIEYMNKVIVTKNPLFACDYAFTGCGKIRQLLLCNRLDDEKLVLNTLKLFETLKPYYPDWTFKVCTSRKELRSNNPRIIIRVKELEAKGIIQVRVGLTKAEYHQELEQSVATVSHSQEESYGICIAESLIYHTIPVLSNHASHPEFVKYGARLFDSLEEGDDARVLEDIMREFENDRDPFYLYPVQEDTFPIEEGTNNLVSEIRKLLL